MSCSEPETDTSFVLRRHPHLPLQLHWSLEYCATARHRSTAVIQCAAHGRSIVARPPPAGHRSPAHTHTHTPRTSKSRALFRCSRTVGCRNKKYISSSVGARTLHGDFSRGESSVCGRKTYLTRLFVRSGERSARSGSTACLKIRLLSALRFTSPGARASCRLHLSDTRARAPSHAHIPPEDVCRAQREKAPS